MRGKGHTTQTERTKGAKDDILVFRVDPIYRNIFAERVRYMACRLTSDISIKDFHLYLMHNPVLGKYLGCPECWTQCMMQTIFSSLLFPNINPVRNLWYLSIAASQMPTADIELFSHQPKLKILEYILKFKIWIQKYY